MKANLRATLSSKSMTYGTPKPFYDMLDRQFGFTVDVCALPHNAKHPRFFTPSQNGLAQSWEGETVWCNPPYGRELPQWVHKGRDAAIHERSRCVFLVPARVDTQWWHDFVLCRDGSAGDVRLTIYDPLQNILFLRREGLITAIYFHDERLTFVGEKDQAPFPSAVVVHSSPNLAAPKPSAVEFGDVLFQLRWPR